jgi:gluconokinase|tara:strand:+ start:136 stop:648 length:513 start_codon:yes stop_codon:yes gene_type:complete
MQNSEITKFIIMGVTGSGKSAVGKSLSDKIGAVFVDGDDMHPEKNITKMSSGQPLTDDDRHTWLQNIGKALRDQPGIVIIACSALKKIYRDLIREMAEQEVMFLHLSGSFEMIQHRMTQRIDHFMHPSLLRSQFDILENPAWPENFIEINIAQPIETVVEELVHNISIHL